LLGRPWLWLPGLLLLALLLPDTIFFSHLEPPSLHFIPPTVQGKADRIRRSLCRENEVTSEFSAAFYGPIGRNGIGDRVD
jgi:hypothetical protein